MATLLKRFEGDENGFIVSSELVLIATVCILGLVAALTCVRDSVVAELKDVAGAIGSLNQSYCYTGMHGCVSPRCGVTAWTAGSAFGDQWDEAAPAIEGGCTAQPAPCAPAPCAITPAPCPTGPVCPTEPPCASAPPCATSTPCEVLPPLAAPLPAPCACQPTPQPTCCEPAASTCAPANCGPILPTTLCNPPYSGTLPVYGRAGIPMPPSQGALIW